MQLWQHMQRRRTLWTIPVESPFLMSLFTVVVMNCCPGISNLQLMIVAAATIKVSMMQLAHELLRVLQ